MLKTVNRGDDRALLIYDTDINFIIALFSCLYAGIIAVPAYPQNQIPGRIDVSVPHLQSIITNASPSIVLTTEKYYSFF
ncbi:hypothetical protein [Candidatus Coxiella mudrowiae]|uniref:hypothetical protein n=1 Tax=Candidatus Coxiella mudrowiae TaxID=2054173 RepID=UPI000A48D617|nr:hypothetical protein [Candidatus Coxiella mudrowiae]